MTYGDPRVDLTPLDLYAAGYVIRPHVQPAMWCWWLVRPCGGHSYGAPHANAEDAIKDARHMMTGNVNPTYPTLSQA